jgi:hypothetical protein
MKLTLSTSHLTEASISLKSVRELEIYMGIQSSSTIQKEDVGELFWSKKCIF